MTSPLVLLIFDGWGFSTETRGNAIALASPHTYNHLLKTYPNILLNVAGKAVGLPEGQMGNSEVGHLNMGAGRIVYQELTRIDHAIEMGETGEFFQNHVFLNAIQHAKKHGSTLHLMGLASDGGVHSQLTHLLALIKLCKQQGLEKLRVHAFLDGRDTPPRSAWTYLEPVEQALHDAAYEQITSIIGRFFAMDRDTRWERIEKAYNMLVSAEGTRFLFSEDALNMAYAQDQSDEFVEPSICDLTYQGFQDDDAVLFFNFRPDRARQLTAALSQPDFSDFDRKKVPASLHVATMSPYDSKLSTPVAFARENLTGILGEVIEDQSLRQYRVAETEKYAHVTYFFNGGREEPFAHEDRCLVPSPKVKTYDMQPAMSLPQVAQNLVSAIESGQYAMLICNFANADMVGHTGNLDAAIEAVQAVDKALEAVSQAVLKSGGTLLITADHGNIEKMLDDDGNPHTAHTTAPVPLIAVSDTRKLLLSDSESFSLCNIAPTMLDILGLEKPAQMTASSLLQAKVLR